MQVDCTTSVAHEKRKIMMTMIVCATRGRINLSLSQLQNGFLRMCLKGTYDKLEFLQCSISPAKSDISSMYDW